MFPFGVEGDHRGAARAQQLHRNAGRDLQQILHVGGVGDPLADLVDRLQLAMGQRQLGVGVVQILFGILLAGRGPGELAQPDPDDDDPGQAVQRQLRPALLAGRQEAKQREQQRLVDGSRADYDDDDRPAQLGHAPIDRSKTFGTSGVGGLERNVVSHRGWRPCRAA